MIRGLIFDFDGLILETEMPDYVAWQEIYQEHGAELSLTAWANAIGRGTADAGIDPVKMLEDQVGRTLPDRDVLLRRQYDRSMELILQKPVMPGVEALIRDAKGQGLGLAVASSSPRSWVEGHMTRLGLMSQFDAIRTGDTVARTKPAPDLFLSALAALGLAPTEAIVFEDSPNGVAAANRAGIFVVAAPNELTQRLDLSHANLIVSSLQDISLAQLLARPDLNGHRPG